MRQLQRKEPRKLPRKHARAGTRRHRLFAPGSIAREKVEDTMPETIHAFRIETPTLVKGLTDVLGARMVALIGGAKSTRSVRAWLAGDYAPDNLDQLRLAHQIVQILLERDQPDVVRAWFSGINEMLDDENPALLLAQQGDEPSVARRLMRAARAFAMD
jgi:hypothetical protein